MKKTKNILGILFVFAITVTTTLNVVDAQTFTHEGDNRQMCSVSSNPANNRGKCLVNAGGNDVCSVIVVAGNNCSGTITISY